MPPEDEYVPTGTGLWLFNAFPPPMSRKRATPAFHKVLPYADKGKATVLGHLRRAIEFNLKTARASTSLPSGLFADWKRLPAAGHQRGTSVFVALQVRYGLTVYYRDFARMLKSPRNQMGRKRTRHH